MATAAVMCALLSTVSAGADPSRSLAPHDGAAPSFSLEKVGGGRGAPGDVAGRVALVHFFATWCEPCRPEMASLDRLHGRLGANGLAILAVSVAEPEARVARFFSDRPVRFPLLLDGDRRVARAWDIHALPSTVVLDRAGRPRLGIRGDLDWERPDVLAALEALLNSREGSEARPETASEQGEKTR